MKTEERNLCESVVIMFVDWKNKANNDNFFNEYDIIVLLETFVTEGYKHLVIKKLLNFDLNFESATRVKHYGRLMLGGIGINTKIIFYFLN